MGPCSSLCGQFQVASAKAHAMCNDRIWSIRSPNMAIFIMLCHDFPHTHSHSSYLWKSSFVRWCRISSIQWYKQAVFPLPIFQKLDYECKPLPFAGRNEMMDCLLCVCIGIGCKSAGDKERGTNELDDLLANMGM